MAETLSVVAQLSAVDKNFTAVFGKADKATQSLGSRIRSGLGFGMLMAAGQKAMSAVTGSVDSAISRVDTLRNFEPVMQSLGYGAEAAGRAMKIMDDGISGLPTTMDGIAKSTQMLTATLGDIDKGAKSAVALNDMFLSGGQGAEAASRALTQYNQILAKGKVDQQSWNTLVEVAPAQMNQLAQSMLGAGKNQKDLYEALQKGTVSIDDLNNAIITLDQEGGEGFKSFADQARAATGGIATQMANVKTAITKGMANMIIAVDDALAANNLPRIGEAFGKLKDVINTAFNAINDRVPAVIGKVVDSAKRFWAAFKETGAINAFKTAITSIGNAFNNVKSALAQNKNVIETIASVVGKVVMAFSKAVTAVSNFVSQLPANVINGITKAIVGAVAGFAVFRTGIHAAATAANKFGQIKSLFTGFKKSTASGMNGAAQAATSGTSKIAQIINSIGNVFKSVGSMISTAAKGIGTGISTAFRGIGQGLSMVNPATLIALGAGIAIVCAGLTLLATQGSGVAQIVTAIGMALGIVANMVIGALADAIVTVSGVVPIICQGLAQLAPLVVAVGQAVGAAAPGITALGNAIATIIATVGDVVVRVMPVIANAFTKVVPVVSGAITQIIGAVTPIVPEIRSMVETLAPVVMKIVDAFSKVVGQISPILNSISNLVNTTLSGIADTISSIGDTISNVVTSIGDSVSSVLDSVAGIFDSIGNAALNAGKGFDLLSKGVKRLTDLKLGDMVATLKETASGISDIAANSDGLPELGNGFDALGKGIQKAATFGAMAGTAFAMISTALIPMKASIETLPTAMAVCAGALKSFSASMLSLGIGLVASTSSFMAFGATVKQLVGSMAALTLVGAIATRVMSTITSRTNKAKSTLGSLGGAFNKAGSMATAASARMTQFTASVTRAGTQAVSAIRSMASQMVSAATSGLSRLSSVGSSSMAKFASGIRAGGSTASSAARSASISAANAMQGGYSAAYSAGTQIGRGLANGILGMREQVRSAAASLASAANRSITVTARIHSPSKVTEKFGKFYGEGFAQGIEEKARRVAQAAKSLVQIPDMALDTTVSYGVAGITGSLQAEILDALQKRPLVIENVTNLDGRQIAKSTAPYMEEDLAQLQARANRKVGIR